MSRLLNSMRHVIRRLRQVPLLGDIVRLFGSVGNFIKHSLFRPSAHDMQRTINLHASALAGIRDSNESLRLELDVQLKMLQDAISGLHSADASLRSDMEGQLKMVSNAISGLCTADEVLRSESVVQLKIMNNAIFDLQSANASLRSETLEQFKAMNDGISSLQSADIIIRSETECRLKSINDAISDLLMADSSLRDICTQNITAVTERLEFVRQETMFEMRRLAKPVNNAIDYPYTAVINHNKIEEQLKRGALRLNIGCGHIMNNDYINVDERDLPGVDIVADASGIPLSNGAVLEIYSSHLLEHFPYEHLRRTVMPHWMSLLKHGGVLRAIVPDAEAMLHAFSTGVMTFDDLREVTFGLQEYSGDTHFNMFSYDSLQQLLETQGFTDIHFNFKARRNGKCFDMEIVASKP